MGHSNNYLKDVSRPIKLGEIFLVCCVVERDFDGNITSITPVLESKHSDKENGQDEIHYHTDFRFIKIEESNEESSGFKITDSRKFFLNREDKFRIELLSNSRLEYMELEVLNEISGIGRAMTIFVRNSKLKHKCIHKGKCPHRGMDLSQVEPVDGVITCPLHSLQFNAETKQLIKECEDTLRDYRNSESKYLEKTNKGISILNKIKPTDVLSNDENQKILSMFCLHLYQTSQISFDDEHYEITITQTREIGFMNSKEINNGKIIKYKAKKT
jgi:nitrite reductase/ring-hydroxylating ferredoxin subunit